MNNSAWLMMLDRRLERINKARPLPVETRRSLAAALRTHMTYASNAIEGNRLTLAETQVVLKGVTVGGKPLRDHLEAIDHAEAWDAMLHWAHSSDPVTPWLLRSLHSLVLRRSQPDTAGQFRTVPVAIAGSRLVPPDPSVVTPSVDDLMGEWNIATGHPVAVSAEMHARLMAIHPFVDGNGRTGRLLLNLWLMRNQYLPALLEPDDRPAYYAALQAADQGDMQPIGSVVIQGIGRTLGIYEEVLRITPNPEAPRGPRL
ncbi:Fic family protein [Sulfobacillus harzensis]|uniref:Fic family protein n=1 Tax=Sulfobacillus harzensis TaxID=2729629 RepID=A0A7Y0L721_9FIRM|nr:Fic family protein [Sulfobacillus harzensis]NMP24415.1 Fic family protein [Sulfobacillus harzensis]